MIMNRDQVTPEWLTEVLTEKGLLPKGKVTQVTPGETRAAFASTTVRLAVSYTGAAPRDAPKRLFLKMTDPALVPGEYALKQLDKEWTFYTTIAPEMSADFIIPCYDAARDLASGASYILLKDVSETHSPCLEPQARWNCEAAVDALAGLHAFWWDHPRLGNDVGNYPNSKELQQEWVETEQKTTAFMAALGDQLPRNYRMNYQRVLTALPDLFKRHATGQNLTLVHGDAHLGNFLFATRSQSRSPYLLDWQFWHPTIGGTDLAFMIATEWEPVTRRSLELPLLQRYYRGLLEHGIQGYSWVECWDDYRRSVILVSIFIPVWRWAIFHWEPDLVALTRSMTAFEDLKCAELL